MTFRTARMARIGATALLATGVLAGLTTPAFAAPGTEADLKIELSGLTVADKATGKSGSVKISNLSKTNTVKSAGVVFSLGKLDQAKVEIPVPENCEKADEIPAHDGKPASKVGGPFILCVTDEIQFGRAETFELRLVRKPGAAAGPAGVLEAVVNHAGGDATPGNNFASEAVAIGASGADLMVVAPDVFALPPQDKPNQPVKPVKPGELGVLEVFVQNQGDKAVNGLKYTITLPKNVTLYEAAGCTVSADQRTATCAYNIPLIPVDQDKNQESEEDGISSGWLSWVVTVDKSVKGPVALSGGVATVESFGNGVTRNQNRAPAALPKNFRQAAPPAGIKDVDPTDNTDAYSVIVAGPQASPSPSASAGPGGTGGGGGLPVTGAQASVIGGTGLAVFAVGALLFFLARRRRVVMVTPGDERPPTA